jgi:hypothetical protein
MAFPFRRGASSARVATRFAAVQMRVAGRMRAYRRAGPNDAATRPDTRTGALGHGS